MRRNIFLAVDDGTIFREGCLVRSLTLIALAVQHATLVTSRSRRHRSRLAFVADEIFDTNVRPSSSDLTRRYAQT
jgi:hypothetical protein